MKDFHVGNRFEIFSPAMGCVVFCAIATVAAELKTWPHARDVREEEVRQHLASNSDEYHWFAFAAHGREAGIPVILLKLLPELAPDIWGLPEQGYSRFGFFSTPETVDRPLPLGLGWVQDPVNGDEVRPAVHRTTLTCAACHVGRVQTMDLPQEPLIMVGAPNTEIDVRKFRYALHKTVDRLFTPTELPRIVTRVQKLIAAKPEGYFFGERYKITKNDEEKERAFFVANADKLLKAFADGVRADQTILAKQLATSYSLPNAPPLRGGTPGQSDGSGDLLPRLVFARDVLAKPAAEQEAAMATFKNERNYPELPNWLATATDNPSVWNQSSRPFGQFDGSVKVPMIRNIAAQVAVVGSSNGVNIENADITARFIARLPAPPYPFPIDTARAARGRNVYDQNCRTCHAASNTTVYPAAVIGTDPNRSRVQTPEGRKLFLEAFLSAIPDGYEATTADGQKYDPSPLQPDEVLNDRSHPNQQGYMAGPLDGIWARAPYLHNGSVPTLRQLLAPDNPDSRRPVVFLRGSIEYDTHNVGFAWRIVEVGLRERAPSAAVFDTRWDGASRAGHDEDIEIDGRLHRLNFSGPDRRHALEDLLEYLKTL